MFNKISNLSIIFAFLITSLGPLPQAQASITDLNLPMPGRMVNLSPAYEPALIKGLTVHKDNPFLFDFVMDTGHSPLQGEALKTEGDRLVKYFFAAFVGRLVYPRINIDDIPFAHGSLTLPSGKSYVASSVLNQIQRMLMGEYKTGDIGDFDDLFEIIKEALSYRGVELSEEQLKVYVTSNPQVITDWIRELFNKINYQINKKEKVRIVISPRTSPRRDDEAMRTDPAQIQGGIDLNNTAEGLNIRKDAYGGVQVTFNAAMIERIHKEGVRNLVPVIIKVAPLTPQMVNPLLGLAPRREGDLAGV